MGTYSASSLAGGMLTAPLRGTVCVKNVDFEDEQTTYLRRGDRAGWNLRHSRMRIRWRIGRDVGYWRCVVFT